MNRTVLIPDNEDSTISRLLKLQTVWDVLVINDGSADSNTKASGAKVILKKIYYEYSLVLATLKIDIK